MNKVYLVLIETSGNQNYIFSTNKLKENIGASHLTYISGTKWILEAFLQLNDSTSCGNYDNSICLRDALRDPDLNPPIEHGKKSVEILTAASGKALLLTKDKETAQKLISQVTLKALKEAPGLDISGVYIEVDVVENFDQEITLSEAIRNVHREFEKTRSYRSSPESRFLRLPIVASCAVSGLPASQLEETVNDEAPKAISHSSAAKRKVVPHAIERLQAIANDQELVKDINKLEKLFDDMSWLAVVHADGNGLGQIFQNFQKFIGTDQSNRNYIKKFREFSLALDECTEEAFRKALQILNCEKEILPIVPLIIGGDDLTVVCHGEYALEFTRAFLQEFETQTQNHAGIQDIAQEAFGVGRLSACAGVAIVKRHFPFSVAYKLAESLIKSAKEVKQKVTQQGEKGKEPFPCSAIDFHILYDTRGINLIDLRSQLQPEPTTYLYNRPYIVSPDVNQAEEQGRNWAALHKWERLSSSIEQLNLGVLPTSQVHALRTALFLGKAEADSQLQLIQQRYENLSKFIESGAKDSTSLFHLADGGNYFTSFLDAIDAMNFLKSR